jgi:hypothetical protein
VILTQLARAFEVIRAHDPARIVTLGGECAEFIPRQVIHLQQLVAGFPLLG